MAKNNAKKMFALGAAVAAAGAALAGIAFWRKKVQKDIPSDEVYFESFPAEEDAGETKGETEDKPLEAEIKQALDRKDDAPAEQPAESTEEENERLLRELKEQATLGEMKDASTDEKSGAE